MGLPATPGHDFIACAGFRKRHDQPPFFSSLLSTTSARTSGTPARDDVGFDRPYAHLLQRPAGRHPADHQRLGRVPALGVPARLLAGAGGLRRDLLSNLDTHADAEGLLRGKGFLSVGHDEYWTRQMFDNVPARDAGREPRVPVRQLGVRRDRTQAVVGRAAGPGVRPQLVARFSRRGTS